jgi:hypothetical protein
MKTVKIDKDFLAGTDLAVFLAWTFRADIIEKHHNKDKYYTIEEKARDLDTVVLDPKDSNLVNGWEVKYKGAIKVHSKKSFYNMLSKHYEPCHDRREEPTKEQSIFYKKANRDFFCGEGSDWSTGYFGKVQKLVLVEDPAMKKNEILFLREGTPRYLFVVA